MAMVKPLTQSVKEETDDVVESTNVKGQPTAAQQPSSRNKLSNPNRDAAIQRRMKKKPPSQSDEIVDDRKQVGY